VLASLRSDAHLEMECSLLLGTCTGVRADSKGKHSLMIPEDMWLCVTLIDNLSNSFMRVLDHMKKLAGDKASLMTFVKVCLLTREFELVATGLLSSLASPLRMCYPGLTCTRRQLLNNLPNPPP
jgi:hypothetical protein